MKQGREKEKRRRNKTHKTHIEPNNKTNKCIVTTRKHPPPLVASGTPSLSNLPPVPANTFAAVGVVAPSATNTQRTCSLTVVVTATVTVVPALSLDLVGWDEKPLA